MAKQSGTQALSSTGRGRKVFRFFSAGDFDAERQRLASEGAEARRREHDKDDANRSGYAHVEFVLVVGGSELPDRYQTLAAAEEAAKARVRDTDERGVAREEIKALRRLYHGLPGMPGDPLTPSQLDEYKAGVECDLNL